MKRMLAGISLIVRAAGALVPAAAAAGGIAVQQNSTVNSLHVIQERNPFHTHESAVSASNGRETATEIIEIGPDPVPLGVTQTGTVNRATIYQRGTAPSLDVQQSGTVNSVHSRQYTMP